MARAGFPDAHCSMPAHRILIFENPGHDGENTRYARIDDACRASARPAQSALWPGRLAKGNPVRCRTGVCRPSTPFR